MNADFELRRTEVHYKFLAQDSGERFLTVVFTRPVERGGVNGESFPGPHDVWGACQRSKIFLLDDWHQNWSSEWSLHQSSDYSLDEWM